MALFQWTVRSTATNARFGFIFDVEQNGRRITISRDPTWTDLTGLRVGEDAAVVLVDRAGGSDVSAAVTWEDIAIPKTISWPSYGLEVDLLIYTRPAGGGSGGWTPRTPGVPAGNSAGVRLTGATQVSRWTIQQDDALTPRDPFNTDYANWIVSDRPEEIPVVPPLRYTTVSEIKKAMRAPDNPEARSWEGGEWDEMIERACRSVEVMIDELCGRRFDLASTQPSSRTFRNRGGSFIDTDDFIGTPVSVSVDDTTYMPDDYHFGATPSPNVRRGITIPKRDAGLSLYRPIYSPGFQKCTISARWGWDRVPDSVVWAANMASIRLFKRLAESAMGLMTMGGGPIYVTRKMDPDVEAQLAPYMVVSEVI